MSIRNQSNNEPVRLGEVKEILSDYVSDLERASRIIDQEKTATQEDIAQCIDDLEDIVAKNIPLYDESIARTFVEEDMALTRALRQADEMGDAIERDRKKLLVAMETVGVGNADELPKLIATLTSEQNEAARDSTEAKSERQDLYDQNKTWVKPILMFNDEYPSAPITLAGRESQYPKAKFFTALFLLAFNPRYRKGRAAIRKIERKDGSLDPAKVDTFLKIEKLTSRFQQKTQQASELGHQIERVQKIRKEWRGLSDAEQERKSLLSPVVLLPLLHKAVARAMFDQKRFMEFTKGWEKKDTSDALSCIVRYSSLSRMKEHLGAENRTLQKQKSDVEPKISKLNKALRTSKGRSTTIRLDRKQIAQASMFAKGKATYIKRNATAMRDSVRNFSGASYNQRAVNTSVSDSSSFWMWMWIMDSNHSCSSHAHSQNIVDPAFARDSLKVTSLDQSVFPEIRDVPTSTANILPDIHALSSAGDSVARDFMNSVMPEGLDLPSGLDIPTDSIGTNIGGIDSMPSFEIPSIEVPTIEVPTFDIPSVDISYSDCGGGFSCGD